MESDHPQVGDLVASLVRPELDHRKVAAVRGDEIKLRIGASTTPWLPASNYRRVPRSVDLPRVLNTHRVTG